MTTQNQTIGEIQSTEFKTRFEVLAGAGDFAEFVPEASHRIEVRSAQPAGQYPYRAASILKTVAYVAVDENENGTVWEKWPIRWL